jgi:hypothetical protein
MKSLALAAALALPVLAHASTPAAPDAPAKPHRVNKMSECNKEAHAKGLKKDERKKFMSTCLSASHTARTPAA